MWILKGLIFEQIYALTWQNEKIFPHVSFMLPVSIIYKFILINFKTFNIFLIQDFPSNIFEQPKVTRITNI